MKLNWILSIAIGLSFLGESNAQVGTLKIPASNGRSAACGMCVPPGWVLITGTPDVSTSTTVAGSNTSGGGQPWTNSPLALPPNNHESWITIRDVGTKAGEEAIQTTMTGLVAGRDYEVVIYTMTAKADNGNTKYSPSYIDSFDFQVGTYPRISVNQIKKDTEKAWGINRLVFTAQGNSMPLKFYPGFNAITPPRANTPLYESVNISVTANAINTLPVGQNFEESVRQKNQPVTLDVGSKAVDYDYDLEHNPEHKPQLNTIDLDVNTPGIQKEFVDATGTWKADENGNVTFTPMTDFEGQATIEYTIQDNYRIDGVLSPGTSIPKTIKINIPPCTTAVKGSDFAVEGGKTKEFEMPGTDYGFQFDIYSLDNSFQLEINGTDLATNEINFQSGNMEFLDDTTHGGSHDNIYAIKGDKTAPVVRVKIQPVAENSNEHTVKILARKSKTDLKLYEMRFSDTTIFNTITWNKTSNNKVIATQDVVGPTNMSGYGSGLKKIVCPCTREALTGTPIGTANVGISTNTITNAKWPSDIKNAALVLDSNSKGMVISRIKNVATDIKAPIEGMIAYDETDQCVKLYNGESWDCLNNACAQ